METQGWKAAEAEGKISDQAWRKEQQWALDMGLPGADSLTDRMIPTFARGELPHFAGINTFLRQLPLQGARSQCTSAACQVLPSAPAPAGCRFISKNISHRLNRCRR